MEEKKSSAHGIRWDLSDLYSGVNDPKVESDIRSLKQRASSFENKYREIIKPGVTKEQMLEAVTELELIYQDMVKPYYYANLVFSEDCKPENGAFLQKMQEEYTKIKQHLIFIELAWCNIPEDEANALMSTPELAKFRHFLEVERLRKPHQLSEAEEKLWSALAVTGKSAFIRLFDETMGNMVVTLTKKDGQTEEVPLDVALNYLREPDRGLRIMAHKAVTRALEDKLSLLAFVFNTLVQDHSTHDEFRKYPHPMSVRNMDNEVDDATVESLLVATDRNVGIVARYYNMKKKIVALDTLYDYDRYAPILPMKKEITYEAAKKMSLEAYYKFSPTTGEIAQKFFDNNWIDAEVRHGKEGGAYSAGMTPDLHPYIKLNHTDDLSDAMTMAHELGHGIHQYLARRNGFLQMSTSLAMAETASVMGEMMLFQDLLKQEEDPKMKLSLLCAKIEDTFATAYRQIMMTRFEKRMHMHRREKGELSIEDFNRMWTEENQWMFGDSVIMTEDYGKWWSYVLHFIHYNFYTYAYAFGELMVLSLYEEYRRTGDEFVGKYLELLASGGSDYPKNMVAKVGLDMTDPDFWQRGFDLVDGLVRQAEELAAELGY